MAKQLSTMFTGAALTLSLLFPGGTAVQAAPGGRYGRGGYRYGRGYGGYGYGRYGYGRGYGYGGWGWGLGLGLGVGLGVGLYYPYYGCYEPYYGVYPAPAYAGPVYSGYASAPPEGSSSSAMVAQKPPESTRPADDAAHLPLLVPEKAEVWINGVKSPAAGKVQEMTTPTMTPGKMFSYVIEVRVKDAAGKDIVDRRNIHFRANDWFSIDFTRPEPTKFLLPAPQPVEENKVN